MISRPKSLWAHYGWASSISFLILLYVVAYQGPKSILPVLTLAIVEITFSFENAVINSQVLAFMTKLWRQIFLSVGIIIAVFGVRLILPIILVALSTKTSMADVYGLARYQPEQYSHLLENAYPMIAAAGGIFLLMVGVHFFTENKDILWLKKIEKPILAVRRPWLLTVYMVLIALGLIGLLAGQDRKLSIIAGLIGGLTFVLIRGFSHLLKDNSNPTSGSWLKFLYLEVLDASFSLDGVVAAFAITKNVILISAGLGIGALYVRSMTVHMLERGVLSHFRYLIHGAHYAIVCLALILLVSIKYDVPHIIAGFSGLAVAILAIRSSLKISD